MNDDTLSELVRGIASTVPLSSTFQIEVMPADFTKSTPRRLISVTYSHTEDETFIEFVYDPLLSCLSHVNMKVAEQQRGQGFGKALDTILVEIGVALGCKTIQLTTIMPGRESFWEELGYVKESDAVYKQLN